MERQVIESKLLATRDTLYISAICPVTREMIDALAVEVEG